MPDIVDVNKLIDLLRHMGVAVERLNDNDYRFEAKDIDIEFFLRPEFKQMGGGLRGSVMIVGPLLARFGRGYIPTPGGDKMVGRRRLDTHFIGFQHLGAEFNYDSKEDSTVWRRPSSKAPTCCSMNPA